MSDTKILIVEDELLIAKGLSRKLKKLGYTVIDIVSSGTKAIQRATEVKPDLILMDIVIKGDIDGIETATQIHEQLGIPVVYLTAYADDQTLDRAETTGSYGYILKPFKDRELHATIKMALKKHQQQADVQQSLLKTQVFSEEKSQLLSMVAHDIRNPLTTIQGSSEILQYYQHKLTEEKQVKHFERIQFAIDNINQMLEDILILGKTGARKLSFEPIPLNALAFCQSILEQFQSTTKQHQLTFCSQKECSQTYLDGKLLSHILANLLSNAIKYSPEGGNIHLEVCGDEQQMIFRVRDQGIGIPPEYQAKLFEQFERADNVGKIPGTGLGLCIVKQAVDLHQGTITMESELGVGTTFTVVLPVLKGDGEMGS
ncbi:MAG: hybrid sensor histidine kinase/response regulator [Symploca sp. SIO2C1]|nr:hybrid sensor histidine kinase/response regulator [Symploca sp. SIO2C1]